MIRKIAGALFATALFALPALADEGARDIFGRQVPVGDGRPALVFYTNEDTRDVLQEHAFALSYDLREKEPIVVVHVDLRGVPGMFKGVARREVRKAHKESVAFMEKYFRDRGIEPPAGSINESLYMVPNYGGQKHKERGLRKGFKSVVAEVRSPEGELVTTGRFPQEKSRLSRAVEADAGNLRYSSR